MMNADEYLKTLNDGSSWVFTKQTVSNFNEIIQATNLFENIPNRESTNIEHYFSEHHTEYGITTDRHRTLVIPQFFGLITKTPFYKKGGQYNEEKTTAVYDKLKTINPNLNLYEYNKIITEQILKLKIHSIVDTANNNQDYHILPVIFIYKVLKELKNVHHINSVSIDHLYTYILTCNDYSQWEQAVYHIANNSPISSFVTRYKDRSRVLTLIKNNIKLFNIEQSTISINPIFDDYFDFNFMKKYDIEELHEILFRDVDYSYFLYNIQGFDVNLIDEPKEQINFNELNVYKSEIIETEETEEEKDDNYISKIDSINDDNVNTNVANGAHLIAPIRYDETAISRKYRRNPLLGKVAIERAYYSCENNPHHETFISAKTNKNFMEAHHFVPVKYQQEIWKKYKINVDCVENIVSLCPTCHRAFHNGTKEVKSDLINNIFNKIIPKYKSINFSINIDEIKKLYDL
ncbi:MAG: hypothetical protein IKH45_07595 [Neisseriaceae bacterium]|nr:hypothetical protein [Neisseriaceae bacterium]